MVVVVVVGRGGGMVRGSRSVSRLLVDLGLQDHRHGADLVQGSHEQAGEQAGQGRDKENSAEPSHFFCRPAQWQGKALEWRVSWAALCSTSICEKPTPQSRKTPENAALPICRAWAKARKKGGEGKRGARRV